MEEEEVLFIVLTLARAMELLLLLLTGQKVTVTVTADIELLLFPLEAAYVQAAAAVATDVPCAVVTAAALLVVAEDDEGSVPALTIWNASDHCSFFGSSTSVICRPYKARPSRSSLGVH